METTNRNWGRDEKTGRAVVNHAEGDVESFDTDGQTTERSKEKSSLPTDARLAASPSTVDRRFYCSMA
jgi:hypothetical protein